MTKRILALVMVMLLVVTAFTGCAKKETAKEMLQGSMDQAATINSASTDMDMKMAVTVSDDVLAADPMIATYIDMINNGSLSFSIASDKKTGTASGKIDVASSGMSFTFDMMMKDFGTMLFKTPFDERYIVLSQGLESLASDATQMESLNKEITTVFMNALKEDNVVAEYGVDFESKDGNMKLDYVTMTFDHTAFVALLNEVVPAVYGNENIQDMMRSSIESQMALSGIEMSKEDIDQQLAMFTTEFPAMMAQVEDMLSFDTVTIKMGMDKDRNVRDTVMNMAMTFKQLDTEVKIALDVTSESYGYNEPVVVDLPELNEENSVQFEEFITQMMFGGMGL